MVKASGAMPRCSCGPFDRRGDREAGQGARREGGDRRGRPACCSGSRCWRWPAGRRAARCSAAPPAALRSGSIGTMTCSSRPPVSLGQLSSPSACRSVRRRSAVSAAVTLNTSMSGRSRSSIVTLAAEARRRPSRPGPKGRRRCRSRSGRRPVLRTALGGLAKRIAHQLERPPREMGQRLLADFLPVGGELGLRRRDARGARQRLLERGHALPRIVIEERQPLGQIQEREMVRADVLAELVPGERHRHRRALARARRVGADGGGAQAVAQVVDIDAAAPAALGHVVGVEVGPVGRHRRGDRLGERFHGVPVCLRRQRKDDVQALAAGGLHEALELQRRQPARARRARRRSRAATARCRRDRDRW